IMDRWLKSGSTTPNENNDYSSIQLTGNNEINDELTSILKEPVKRKSKENSQVRQRVSYVWILMDWR
ncbi:hypothetical protein NPIL_673951, partial [Nephila pilipes]